jgi:nucleoid-associated protein YgaU
VHLTDKKIVNMSLLVKLTIIPLNDLKKPIPSGPPFIVPFNPETFTISNEIEYVAEPIAGKTGSVNKFKQIKEREFSFDIFLDGTGASGPKLPVFALIKAFEVSMGVVGNLHRPSFFLLTWAGRVLKAVLNKYTINYTLFSPSGMPLRAVISTEWKESVSQDGREKLLNLLSPDVTHNHTVLAGENLSQLSYKTYNEEKYYMEVARTNNLDNVRNLTPGQNLELFPLA